jgi:hypothetical protein
MLEREVRAFDSKRSTARDDAPNADKQDFFEGDPGDRVAFVPFVLAAQPTGFGGGIEKRGAIGRTIRVAVCRLFSKRGSRRGRPSELTIKVDSS